MKIVYIPFITFILLLLIALSLLLIPNNLKRQTMIKGIRKIQIYNIFGYIIALIITIIITLTNKDLINFSLIITSKLYILLVLIITFFIFGICIYFPCILKLSSENSYDLDSINNLFIILIKIKYLNEPIKILSDFITTNKQILFDYGSYEIYSSIITNAIPETNIIPSEISTLALNHCESLINKIENFKPEPFPILNIIFAFCGTTIITLITTLIALG